MDANKEAAVYIISGPAGVGKSTTARALAESLSRSALIHGDMVSHMSVNGRQRPWESEEALQLIWENILSLSKNFLKYDVDVVVDFVTFPKEARWFYENLMEAASKVVYVVLWCDKETLLQRDAEREPNCRMGERCLILHDEFNASGLASKHKLNTNDQSADMVNYIVEQLMNDTRFLM